jgi:diguanylate cyclase (GGDEF)-like protein
MQDCWAMRRGQQHEVSDPQTNVICNHFIHPPKTGYICLPMVVQGEILGLFYIDSPAGMDHEHAISRNQLVVTVGESIKLSLSNLKLRKIMHEHATIDSLTGLFNRRYLDDTLPREVIRAQRQNTQICLAMLDIDHFKQFNDAYGHAAGDALLHKLGSILQENVRKSDIACRFGGEEFVIVLLDSPLEASYRHLEKIRAILKEMQISYGDQILSSVTLSIGLIEASKDNLTAEEILRFADQAMYAAKRAGRDCIFVYHDLLNCQERNE